MTGLFSLSAMPPVHHDRGMQCFMLPFGAFLPPCPIKLQFRPSQDKSQTPIAATGGFHVHFVNFSIGCIPSMYRHNLSIRRGTPKPKFQAIKPHFKAAVVCGLYTFFYSPETFSPLSINYCKSNTLQWNYSSLFFFRC